jgi:hypothetical protein
MSICALSPTTLAGGHGLDASRQSRAPDVLVFDRPPSMASSPSTITTPRSEMPKTPPTMTCHQHLHPPSHSLHASASVWPETWVTVLSALTVRGAVWDMALCPRHSLPMSRRRAARKFHSLVGKVSFGPHEAPLPACRVSLPSVCELRDYRLARTREVMVPLALIYPATLKLSRIGRCL